MLEGHQENPWMDFEVLEAASKRETYQDLMKALSLRIQLNPSQFNNAKYDWSIRTWMNVVHNVVNHCTFYHIRPAERHFLIDRDCWNTNYKKTRGYSTMKVTPVLNSSYSDVNLVRCIDNAISCQRIPSKVCSLKQRGGKATVEQTSLGETIAVHRIIHALYNPKDVDQMRARSMDPNVSHLCGRRACVSPYHIHLQSHIENINRKGCMFGLRRLCPHDPKCIFVGKEGVYLPCLNKDTEIGSICPHPYNCFQAPKRILELDNNKDA